MIFLGGVITTVIVMVVPYVLAVLGLGPSVHGPAWFMLFLTTVGLLAKAWLADQAGGEFLWEKFGFDNCMIAFGGFLAALGLQVVTKTDLFPGLDNLLLLKDIPLASADRSNHRLAQLIVAVILAMAAGIFAARNVRKIKENATSIPLPPSLASAVLGAFFLALYVTVLIKGA